MTEKIGKMEDWSNGVLSRHSVIPLRQPPPLRLQFVKTLLIHCA